MVTFTILYIHIYTYTYTHTHVVNVLKCWHISERKKMRITIQLVVHVQPELGNSFDWLSEIIFVICDLFLSGLSVCSQRGQRRPDGGWGVHPKKDAEAHWLLWRAQGNWEVSHPPGASLGHAPFISNDFLCRPRNSKSRLHQLLLMTDLRSSDSSHTSKV